MSASTSVYFDVENTLHVPFISGIQRVVRELSRRLIGNSTSGFEFIPVVYCSHCQGWRRLSDDESGRLQKINLGDTRIADSHPGYRRLATKLLSKRIKARLRNIYEKNSHPAWHKDCALPIFETGSIFLDIDASWHNEFKRSKLLPALKVNGVFVITFHYDIIPILFPEMTHENTYPIFREHLHAHIQYSDLFICISKNTEKDLLEYCQQQFPEKKINTTTIKLGADISSDSIKNEPFPLAEKNIKYILCVGTIEPRKNYDFVLDAFDIISSKFPDINLVIVGREGWHSEKTVARIQQHEWLDKRLYWLTKTNDATLASLYENAYLTVVPSLYEGFGLPVTEALQRGCVTLSSDRGALKEAGGKNVDYFNPEEPQEFIELLESYVSGHEVVKQKELLKSYQAPGWSNTVRDFMEILHKNLMIEVLN